MDSITVNEGPISCSRKEKKKISQTKQTTEGRKKEKKWLSHTLVQKKKKCGRAPEKLSALATVKKVKFSQGKKKGQTE